MGELSPPAFPWHWTCEKEEDGAGGQFYEVRCDAPEGLQHVARLLTSREDPCGNPALAFPQASSPTYILTEFVSPVASLATRFQLRN